MSSGERADRDILMPLRSLLVIQFLIVFIAEAGITAFGLDLATPKLSDSTAIAAGAVAGISTFALICGLSHVRTAFRHAIRRQSRFLQRFAASYTLGGLLAMSVLAGLGEELFFRALVQGGLAEWCGGWLAMLIASLIFGLAHCLSLAYFLMATVMGLLLGTGYLLSGSLLMVMVWHAVYDLVALVALARYPGLLGGR